MKKVAQSFTGCSGPMRERLWNRWGSEEDRKEMRIGNYAFAAVSMSKEILVLEESCFVLQLI